MPPQQAWDTAPALGGPDQLPVQRDAQIKTLTVSASGEIRPFHDTVISVGRAHAGLNITTLIDGDHITLYQTNGRPLGHLTIDWTQQRQQLRPAA